jgi:hypothetical protein
MDNIDDKLWQAFEHLAEQYPHDHGVRMTSDLARWLTEERQRALALLPTVSDAATWPAPAAVGYTEVGYTEVGSPEYRT